MQTHGVTNPADTRPLRVGVVHWYEDERGDGIVSLLSRTLGELGCETNDFFHNEVIPEGLDVVLVCGPFDSLVPLANQLLAYPPSRRPLLVLWMTEQFPNPDLPEWVRYLGGIAQAYVYRALGGLAGTPVAGALGDWVLPFFYNVTLGGFRASVLGWLFLGGLVALEQMFGEQSYDHQS